MAKRVTTRLQAVLASTDCGELMESLHDPSSLVVEAAARKLKVAEAVPALVKTYERLEATAPGGDPACRGRLAILTTLAELQASEAAPLAMRAIRTVQVEAVGFGPEDTAVNLRSVAAGVLGILNPPGGLLELAYLLNDREPEVGDAFEKMGPRIAAARALAATGEPTAQLLLALKLRLPEGELPEVLSECMDALLPLVDASAAELFLPYVTHSDPYLIATAATNLASLLKEEAVGPLLEALPVAPEAARVALVYALASIRCDSARAALSELIDHPDSQVRAAAKECLC